MSALPAVTVVEPVMGTVVTVQVRGRATTDAAVRAQVDTAIAAVIARMRDDEGVFSTYRPDSDVSLLRDGLRGLDERSRLVGGVLTYGDRGDGFLVHASLPVGGGR